MTYQAEQKLRLKREKTRIKKTEIKVKMKL
jgi:hypothetical protein